jgi:hypothetical protein
MAEPKKTPTFNPNNPQHVVSKGGRQFITFVGLQAKLKDANMSVVGAKTDMIQNGEDHDSGRWIIRTTLTVKHLGSGNTAEIQAIGDATKENTGAMVWPHAPRMAETRAWVRALRLVTRSEYTALDEIGE